MLGNGRRLRSRYPGGQMMHVRSGTEKRSIPSSRRASGRQRKTHSCCRPTDSSAVAGDSSVSSFNAVDSGVATGCLPCFLIGSDVHFVDLISGGASSKGNDLLHKSRTCRSTSAWNSSHRHRNHRNLTGKTTCPSLPLRHSHTRRRR